MDFDIIGIDDGATIPAVKSILEGTLPRFYQTFCYIDVGAECFDASNMLAC